VVGPEKYAQDVIALNDDMINKNVGLTWILKVRKESSGHLMRTPTGVLLRCLPKNPSRWTRGCRWVSTLGMVVRCGVGHLLMSFDTMYSTSTFISLRYLPPVKTVWRRWGVGVSLIWINVPNV
jgi:hypothetical protein